MVADDLALMSQSEQDMQTCLIITENDSSRERYTFNADKTKVVPINCKNHPTLDLYGKTLGISNKEAHLGIQRNCKANNNNTVEARIASARKAIMSLLGAGLRGYNGVGPEMCMKMYQTYILPILTYGLQAVVLNEAERNTLELYPRQNLRCLQHIPKSTAIPAIHLLIAIPPLEAIIDIKSLSFFRNVVVTDIPSPPSLLIKEIIVRQVAMKDMSSNSWTTRTYKEAPQKIWTRKCFLIN